MSYIFNIGGKINAETLDDAIDILTLLLEDKSITITRLDVGDKKKAASIYIPKTPKFCSSRPNFSFPILSRYPPKQKQKLEGTGEIK